MENENRTMDEVIEITITKANFDAAKAAAEAFGYYRGKADAYREMMDTAEKFIRAVLYHKWQQG